MTVETVEAENLPEGIYAAGLAEIAKGHEGRFNRLLPVLYGRRIPEPDRGSREGLAP